MSKVKKWYIGVYGGEAQARPCSPAEFEIIRDRDRRYFVIEEDYERVTAERDALQLSLTTADNRFDTAAALLRETSAVLRGGECYGWEGNQAASIDAFLDGSEGATCTWKHVDDRGIWDTGCGTSWAFTDEGPKENGMKFCHACGKTLIVEDAGDDD